MPTLLDRIEAIPQNEKLSVSQKVDKLIGVLERNKSGHAEAIAAISKIEATDTPDLYALDKAAQNLLKYAQSHPEHARSVIATTAKIAALIVKGTGHNAKDVLHGMAALSNAIDEKGLASFTAQAIADADCEYFVSSAIDIIETYPEDAHEVIFILKEYANALKKPTFMHKNFDDEHAPHNGAVKALANIAMPKRHPELADEVFEALADIGSECAATHLSNLIATHYMFRIPPIRIGRKKSVPHNAPDIPLNQGGVDALVRMGDIAVQPLYALAASEAYGNYTYFSKRQMRDTTSIKTVIDALTQINTKQSLRAVAQIMLDNPEMGKTREFPYFYGSLEPEDRKIEDYGFEKLVELKSAKAASAIVDFGAGIRLAVSEAYSDRARASLESIMALYRSANFDEQAKGEIKGIKKAAKGLAAAITSEESLKRRFIIGDRRQASVGRKIPQNSRINSYSQKEFEDQEHSRHYFFDMAEGNSKRTKKTLEREVKRLKSLFKKAKEMGLLEKDDTSLENLETFQAWHKAQEKRAAEPRLRVMC